MPRAETFGLRVHRVGIKDVILPGEMREILNQVVAAEKQAEANVIRRREETNATRSLLNTAKVMAENTVMLRLKELEALETIAGKVERLTVHNGTVGLLNDLVKLRDAMQMSSGASDALKEWDMISFTWALKDMQIVSKMTDNAGLSLPLTGMVREQVKDARRVKATPAAPAWTGKKK